MDERMQSAITLIIVATYCYLVCVKIASVEGFVGLAMYVVKKYLDYKDVVQSKS